MWSFLGVCWSRLWPVSSLLKHAEAMKGGGDILRADPGQFAE